MAKPHIIYIISHEYCGQTMSHAGDPNVETPWMDHLTAYYAMNENFVWNIERLNQCLQSQPSIANTL